jgi:hypothetical protein
MVQTHILGKRSTDLQEMSLSEYHLRTTLIFLFLFTFFCNCYGQHYLLPNEIIVYSFNMANGKKMVLAKDSTNKYIVYRFGTKDKIEFEFPEKNKASWDKFTYCFYLRAGGKENEGMDLNYVYFINNKSRYIIYNTYHAANEKPECGIMVIDTTTKKKVDIKGNINTAKGTLIDFRDNNLLQIGDELFE